MTIYRIPNSTSGIDQNLIEVISQVPSFTVGILLFVFCVIFFGGSSSQRRRVGHSDAPMWAVLSSLTILMVSLLMSLTEGLISLEVLGIVIAITIFSGIWLFLSRGRGEF